MPIFTGPGLGVEDGRYVNVDGDTMTGNLGITKADPEFRLTDSGNSEYSRLLRSDTLNQLNLYNRVTVPAGTPYGLLFDGSGDYITLQATNFLSTLQAWTFSLWIKPTNTTGTRYVWKRTGIGSADQFYIQATTNTLVFDAATITGRPSIVGTTALTAGTWWHVVYVWDYSLGATARAKMYVNGVDQGACSTSTGTSLGNNNTVIGDSSTASPNSTLDELKFYNVAWSQAQVTADYNAGAGVYGLVSDTGLLAGYHLDEGSGTSATDFSGGTTRTITNATYAAGKVVIPSSASEVAVITSVDGVAAAEAGIHTFGTALGQSILQGSNVWLKDSNGNELLTTAQVASAVNQLTITNAITTAAPILSATGGDTNIGITIAGKGTGAISLGQATSTGIILVADQPILDSASNEYIKFVKTASAVNELTITNAATTAYPILSATGGDTNIGLSIMPKGTGGVGINMSTPTARMHLPAGTATASTAPLKFTTGTLLTAPEAGAVEFLTDAYYGTITTGTARKKFAFEGGAVVLGYTAKTALYTITTSDYVIDCTANTFTVTLPTAVGITGQVFIVKNSGTGGGIITIDGNGTETIDGALTKTLNTPDSITVMSNNSNWIII